MERWAHALKDGRTAVIRRAIEADAEALIRNINEVGAEQDWILTESLTWDLRREREWIRGFDDASSILYVAEVDGRVVGQIDAHTSTYPKARHVASLGIAIVRAYRGLGIGRLLMERVLTWMRVRGIEKAVLEVFSTNERAIALYRKMGFEVEGARKRHYKIRGKYVDDVMMAKWL
ncbi:MAG TPA: GNAT family N-acetyltransferase [Thermoplasmata archaeon]|nr:GNAT family N-acetyltransferase [Thermoplasmata archaeon]